MFELTAAEITMQAYFSLRSRHDFFYSRRNFPFPLPLLPHLFRPMKTILQPKYSAEVRALKYASVHCRLSLQEIRQIGIAIGHFRVHLSLHFKARVSAKSLLWKSVFIHIEIRTNYDNKKFALRLALKERLRGTRKWPIEMVIGCSLIICSYSLI